MSENLNRGTRDFSQYDAMETEKLEEILRLDAEAPEDTESDTELLLYVMEVLASRRNNSNITGNTAQEAWESFQKHYMPEECLEKESAKEHKLIAAPWVRRMIAAAAAIAFVVIIPISAKAFGYNNLWDVIARWAKDTVSFVSDKWAAVSAPTPNDQDEYMSLQEMLREHKRDYLIIPTYIPEGFTLDKLEKETSPSRESYRATYQKDGKIIKIRVQTYLESDPGKIEINNDLVEVYNSRGIEYYIFANYEQNRAVWIIDSYECYIAGDLSINEIKCMIDTIGEG